MAVGRSRNTALLVIVLVAVFYALTMRAGVGWGDDYALYIAHAQNIVAGRPYAATGYIYNAAEPQISPPAYPPLFPVMLAPLVAAAGLNFTLMKYEVAVFLLAALWAIYLLLRRYVPGEFAAAAVALLGFNPYLWEFKDNPASDVPFLFLVFLTFNCILRAESKAWPSWREAVLIGVLLYLCFACRAAGVVMPLCLGAAELLRHWRAPRRRVWAAIAIGMAGIVVQSRLLRGETSYIDQLRGLDVVRILAHLQLYIWGARSALVALPGIAGYLVLAVLALLGLYGYVLALRRGITVLEIFVPAYAAMIALWTSDVDTRFLLPLFPLLLLYVCIGLVAQASARKAAPLLAAVLAIAYLGYYARASYGPMAGGINDAGFMETCRFVREKTPADAVLVFSHPRLLALLSGRRSSIYPSAGSDPVLNYCRRTGASYVIAGDAFESDRRLLIPLIRSRPDLFDPVFHAGGFVVYRFHA